MRNVLPLMILLMACFPAFAQEADAPGWYGTQWGAKVPEIREELPATEIVSEPEVSDGMEGRLTLPVFELAGFEYSAILYFNPSTDGLQRVSLKYDAKPPVDPGRNAQTACGRVDDLLHKKYGTPTRNLRNGERVSGLFMTHRHWILPTTTIRLLSADSVEVGGFC